MYFLQIQIYFFLLQSFGCNEAETEFVAALSFSTTAAWQLSKNIALDNIMLYICKECKKINTQILPQFYIFILT